LYDQGGLVLVFPKAGEEEVGQNNRWIKTGIEYYQGEAMVSTVSCDLFADWSLLPLPRSSASTAPETSVTLEMEWKDTGSALWIYIVDGEKRIPIREVTWVLSGEIDKEADVWVGVYAATPIMEGGRIEGEALEVKFENFKLVSKD
jgi:regulation of enolase protein 1 (concanavalin A-like superfamily)